MQRTIEGYALFNNVRKIRIQQDFSISVLSERIGVSRQALYEIENERRVPSLLTAYKLAWFFNKPIEDIFRFYVDCPDL